MGLCLERRSGEAVDVFANGEHKRLRVVHDCASHVVLEYGGEVVEVPLRHTVNFQNFEVQYSRRQKCGAQLYFTAPDHVRLVRAELLKGESGAKAPRSGKESA